MENNNTTTKKKGFKPWILILIVLGISIPLILSAVLKKQMAKLMGNVGTPVDVETAVKGSLSQELEISGQIQTEETKSYFAPVSATVATCDYKPGDIVKAGDMLVTFDTSDLQEQLENAKLEEQVSDIGSDITVMKLNESQQDASEAEQKYKEAEAYEAHFADAVANAKIQLGEATELQNKVASLTAQMKELNKALAADPDNKKLKKEIGKLEKELTKTSKKLEKYDVAGIKQAIEVCSEDLAEYKAIKEKNDALREQDPTIGLQKQQQAVSKQLAGKTAEKLEEEITKANQGVRCEFDGVITQAAAQEGMAVAEGVQLFEIQSTKNLKVVLSAGKNDLEKLEVGQKATIKIGEKEYDGEVSAISKVATTAQGGAISVDVDVHIDQPDDSIILGTEGKVTVETAEKDGIILIPMVCLNYSSDSTFVYLIKDGKLAKASVETGISDDEMIEIVSGVSEGDQIVKNITSDLTEGMDVIPKKDTDDKDGDKEEKDK